jgi:cell division septation protein DedD
MADHNDRSQGPDDLYDEAPPRSIFAATWFRAVLVLIVLGVIGAVAVPYILDAMNAPPGRLSASAPAAPPLPAQPPASALAPTTPAPAPPTAPPEAATATASSTSTPASASSSAPNASDKPTDRAEASAPAPAAPTTQPAETMKAESAPTPKAPASGSAAKPAVTAKTRSSTAGRSSTRQWFVQVGAFKDPDAAHRVAAKLREDKYTVVESAPGTPAATVAKATTTTSNGTDRYDVIVAGQSPAELNERLAAKGLTAEASAAGAVVKPSLPLRDAVALSKDLAVDGLKVQVRRAGGARATAQTPRATSGASDGLHRVSVGGFTDRPAAVTTLKELEAKGYKPFLTRR